MPTELLLAAGGLVAGAFGAVLGLGGGILIVPLLTLVFGLPLSAAVGTSLVCVVATSNGGAAVNLATGRADVRLGLVLGMGTVIGAVIGASLAGLLPERALAGLFAVVLGYTTVAMVRGLGRRDRAVREDDVDPTVPDGPDAPAYRQQRVPLAVGGSVAAGGVSGLLGVGGGVVIVPLIHLAMGAPMRIAAATSNYMIGITGATGAYVYLLRGEIDLRQAAPVVLGVVAGAVLGARVAPRLRSTWLVATFAIVLGYVTFEMARRALGWA